MASSRLLKNVTEDYLTCIICLQRYKDPRTLPCEHTLCMVCLANHIQANKTDGVFCCPIDKKEIAAPDTAADHWECARSFPVDPLISGFLKAIEETQENHVKSEMEEGALEFYCFGCKVLTSAETAVQNHRQPSCDCVKLKNAYHRLLPQLSKYGRQLESLLIKSEKIKKENEISDKISETQQDVLKHLDNFELRLDDFYTDCKRQIQNLKNDVVKPDTETDKNIAKVSTEVYDKVATTYTQFNKALEEEDVTEIMSEFVKMDTKLTALNKSVKQIPNKSRKLSFDFMPDLKLMELLRNPPKCGLLRSYEKYHFHAHGENTCEEYNFYDAVVTEKYIVLCDGENDVLQRFLHNGAYVDSLKLSNPCRMTLLADDEIAITRFFKRKITTVVLGRKMHVKEHIKTKKPYIGICPLSNGKFCVSFYDGEEPSGLDIISHDGKVLKSIQGHRNPIGDDALFAVPMFITSSARDNIFVCDYRDSNHLLCYNNNLDLLWCRNMTSMPCGVTCNGDSTLFVSLPDEDRVIAINEENGEKLRTLVRKSDGVKRPYAVRFSKGKLIVTEDETDKVHIVHL